MTAAAAVEFQNHSLGRIGIISLCSLIFCRRLRLCGSRKTRLCLWRVASRCLLYVLWQWWSVRVEITAIVFSFCFEYTHRSAENLWYMMMSTCDIESDKLYATKLIFDSYCFPDTRNEVRTSSVRMSFENSLFRSRSVVRSFFVLFSIFDLSMRACIRAMAK